MAKIHHVVPGTDTDLGWTFVAGDTGHIATGDTIASVTSVKAYDHEGVEVAGVFAASPAPSVDDDSLTALARCNPSAVTFTTDRTLWVEVIAESTNGDTVVWTDEDGERPRLRINARP